MNRAVGELDRGHSGEEGHSCSALKICEGVSAAQGAAEVAAGAAGSSDTQPAFLRHSWECWRGL